MANMADQWLKLVGRYWRPRVQMDTRSAATAVLGTIGNVVGL